MQVRARAVPVGAGVRCEAGLYAVGGTTSRPLTSHVGPVTYLVADIGRRGAPRLDNVDATMVRTIARDLRHPTSLRFTFLGRRLIVYDAVDGTCSAAAPGYQVLNVRSCNTGYMPGDIDNGRTTALPDCLYPLRPWIDHGR